MRYRVTCTIIWDFESDLPQAQALQLARKHLDEIPSKDGMEDIRCILNLDCLRSKVERIKLGEVALEDVFSNVTVQPSKKTFDINGKEYKVKMNVDRYQVFANNRRCVACGLESNRVFLECNPSDKMPHFNFYGEEDGKLILFTKDHIKAKAFGGEDSLSNYQTMCSTCNSLKAHSNLSLENVKKLRDMVAKNKKTLTKRKLHTLIEEERMRLEEPWPHFSLFSNEKPCEDAVRVLQDLTIYEANGDLIGYPSIESHDDCKKVMTVKKGVWLESILEINDSLICKLTDQKLAKLNKKLVK